MLRIVQKVLRVAQKKCNALLFFSARCAFVQRVSFFGYTRSNLCTTRRTFVQRVAVYTVRLRRPPYAFGSKNKEGVHSAFVSYSFGIDIATLGAQQRLISGLATFAFTSALLALTVKLNGF